MALAFTVPVSTNAGVTVSIGIPLPPPIVFSAPPEVVLLPHTGVYVAPDLAVDLFFFGGWWWRSWEGRWYRSQNYRSGWGHYNGVPSFYGRVPSGWRDDYRNNRWNGREWNHQRLSHSELQKIYQRAVQKKSKQPKVKRQKDKPKPQAVRSQPQVRKQQQQREVARPQQARPQQRERSAPQHSQSPHGGSEGRK